MMSRLCAQFALTLIVLLVVAVLPAAVHATSFSYQVDRFEVTGNVVGSLVEEFDDGVLAPWELYDWGTAVESGDHVTLTSPGVKVVTTSPDYVGISESSVIHSPPVFRVSDGAGDFSATSSWEPTLPTLDDPELSEYFNLGINYFTNDGDFLESVSIGVVMLDPSLASLVGLPAGLSISQAKWVKDGPAAWGDPEGEGVIYSEEYEGISIDPADISGQIVLRLSFDDDTNLFTSSFSLDGGSTFEGPLSPISSGLTGDSWFWQLGATSMVPEPSTALLFACGLAGLAAATRRRSLH